MRREIRFRPAFDKRHPEPSKNYGIHGVEMCWYLHGPEAVIQFIVYTNWHLPKVQEEIDNKPRDKFTHLSCHPMAADIGYHAKKPQYENQPSRTCDFLGECYYDGSTLMAEEYLALLIELGDEAVWQKMQAEYDSRFPNNAAIAQA